MGPIILSIICIIYRHPQIHTGEQFNVPSRIHQLINAMPVKNLRKYSKQHSYTKSFPLSIFRVNPVMMNEFCFYFFLSFRLIFYIEQCFNQFQSLFTCSSGRSFFKLTFVCFNIITFVFDFWPQRYYLILWGIKYTYFILFLFQTISVYAFGILLVYTKWKKRVTSFYLSSFI